MVKVLPRRLRHPFLERFESNLETICLLLDSFWQVVFMVFCYCSFGDVDVDSFFLFAFGCFVAVLSYFVPVACLFISQ